MKGHTDLPRIAVNCRVSWCDIFDENISRKKKERMMSALQQTPLSEIWRLRSLNVKQSNSQMRVLILWVCVSLFCYRGLYSGGKFISVVTESIIFCVGLGLVYCVIFTCHVIWHLRYFVHNFWKISRPSGAAIWRYLAYHVVIG